MEDMFNLSLFYTSYAFILTQFILFCFAEQSPLADDDMVRIIECSVTSVHIHANMIFIAVICLNCR